MTVLSRDFRVCVCVWQEVKASPLTVTQGPLKDSHKHTHTHALHREEDAALSPLTQEVLFSSAVSCLSHLDPYTHTDRHTNSPTSSI